MAVIRLIGDGLWQWDTGRKVCVTLPDVSVVKRVDFKGGSSRELLSMKVLIEDGKAVAEIPNEFLQHASDITAYVVISHPGGERTIFEEVFEVEDKEKPPGYICEQQDILRYENLEERIAALEEGGPGSGKPGADGYSPEASVEQTTEGAVITITDKAGTTTATVRHGKDGQDGQDGKSAYEYAKAGGYTGTEAEFAQKMAEENPTKEEFNKLSEDIDELKKGGTGLSAWRTIREFTIEDETFVASDTESGITWTVDDSGNITAFEFDTDSDGKVLNANRLRWYIYPSEPLDNRTPIFGGKTGYLYTYCNEKDGALYNATRINGGHRIEAEIYVDMSGILKQISNFGDSRNSYGNEKVVMNFFHKPGNGFATPPIQKIKIACDAGIWFVKGAKVLVQVCEEVG